MEAMASGLPVIATAVGGIPELIEDHQHGILVSRGDGAALERAMEFMLNHAKARRLMGAAARDRARSSFGTEHMVGAYEKLYDAFLSGEPQVEDSSQAPSNAKSWTLANAEWGARQRLTHNNGRGKRPLQSWVRSVIERFLAAVGLVCWAPILLVCGLCITLESGRPVLFRQTRVGQNGRPFRLLKLRSMYTNRAGTRVTAAGDSRVTRTGKFLRKYKLDELPQLWNVIVGDMQLIGPRPEVPSLVNFDDTRWQMILSEKPGLADLSTLVFRNEEDALSAHADPETTYEQVILPKKLRLSAAYQSRRNFYTDCKLLVLTARYSFVPAGFDPERILPLSAQEKET
jgi:lipopolysaccharide/colanic/teichoic acid biosynthesis glycosyltransferase